MCARAEQLLLLGSFRLVAACKYASSNGQGEGGPEGAQLGVGGGGSLHEEV